MQFGAALAAALDWPCLVFLEGELGTGKTTLVRGLLRAMGHQGPVRSPTYTLIESYETGSGPVHHLDLYRIGDAEELEYLGLRELLDEALVLIEWPERGRGWLPVADLRLQLSQGDQSRRILLSALSPRGEQVLQQLRWPEPDT